MTWVDEVTSALNALGGEAVLSEIYDHIKRHAQRELPKSWQAMIRQTLEDNSSDGVFRARRDLFRSVGGKRSGRWGLRKGTKEVPIDPYEVDAKVSLTEGATVSITVNRYERSHEAREACIAHHGTTCSVCTFDFHATYGEIGEGYIHVHHLTPLAMIGDAHRVDPVADLRPVCANCHAMLHANSPPYSIEELQSLMASAGRIDA